MKKKIISVIIAAAITVGLALSAFMLAFADEDPIQVWNVRDEVSKGVTAAANSGTNLVGTKVSAIDCGDMSLIAKYYSYIKSLTATKITTTQNSNGLDGGCNHGYLQFTETGIKTHLDYGNAHGVKFIAPKSGIYNIVPTENLVVENTQSASYFTVTAAGKPLAIGPDGETNIDVASGLLTSGKKSTVSLKEVSVRLDAGDALEITGNGKSGYQTFFTYDFDIEFMEDLTPLNSWTLRDNISSSLAELVASGENKNGTPMSDLDFGDFSLRANYYSKVGSITATQINNNGCAHGYLKITDTGVRMHQDYQNEWGIKFTAPKTGVYRFAPKGVNGANSVYFDYPAEKTCFKVTYLSQGLPVGPNGETEISVANGLITSGTNSGVELKEITLTLDAGDIVEFTGLSAGTQGWNGYITFNYYIEFIEDKTPAQALKSYNMADDIRDELSWVNYNNTAYQLDSKGNMVLDDQGNPIVLYNYNVAKTSMFEYPLGNFYLTNIQAETGSSTSTIQEIEKGSSEYRILGNLKNTGKEGWQKNWYSNPNVAVQHTGNTYSGLRLYNKLWEAQYEPAYTFTFVAPENGSYNLVNKIAYAGKCGSIYNQSSNREAYLSISVNGKKLNVSSEADPTVLTIGKAVEAKMPDIGILTLEENDIVEFKFSMQDAGKAITDNGVSIYVNFDINIISRTDSEIPIVSYDMAEEVRKTLMGLDFYNANYEVINQSMLDYSFGPFNFVSMRDDSRTIGEIEKSDKDYKVYSNLKNTGVEGYQRDFYGSPYMSVLHKGSSYKGIALSAKHYETSFEFSFTAPSDGTYKIKNKSAHAGTPDTIYNKHLQNVYFSLYVNGVAQKISDQSDPTILTVASGTFADIPDLGKLNLEKDDIIKFRVVMDALPNKIEIEDGKEKEVADWSTGTVYINFTVDAFELGDNLETAHTTFNVGDEMRKTFANSTELNSVIENNKFGPFTFTLKYRNDVETAKFQDANAIKDGNYWSAKTSVYPNPSITTGFTDALYPGYALRKQDYGDHKLITTFTAPTSGTYRFVPQDCYQGKTGSVYNNYIANAIITVEINGVKQGNDLVVPAQSTADLKRIDNIKLDKGDTITVTINTEAPKTTGWGWYYTYVNYDIDLVTTADENFYYAGIELSDNIAKAGNKTYVDLGLTNLMENVSGFSAKVKFDKNLFEFVRAENLSVTAEDFQAADNGAGEVGIVYVSDSNDIGNNSVVRLYFKVKDGVAPSTYTMTPTEAMFVRINNKDKTKVEKVNFTNFVTDDAALKVR